MHNFVTHDDELEEEIDMGDDEEATLDDDLLDEVSGDDADADADLMEGFGILPEGEEEEEKENDDEEQESDDELEEDAEDVDFDRFDDVDEM